MVEASRGKLADPPIAPRMAAPTTTGNRRWTVPFERAQRCTVAGQPVEHLAASAEGDLPVKLPSGCHAISLAPWRIHRHRAPT